MKSIFKLFFGMVALWAVEAKAVNVAVVAPRVGYMAKFGNELAEGAQIAVDIINQNGGINGEKVNLIMVDDRCQDSFAVSAAQMMSVNSSDHDKISLVIGLSKYPIYMPQEKSSELYQCRLIANNLRSRQKVCLKSAG